jgi:hydroxyacylglutathione hydrolase
MLHLKQFTFNPFQQNTFVVYNDEGQAFFIDAGNSTSSENEALSKFVTEKKLKPERLLLTHAHIDHVMGARYIQDKYGLLPEVHTSEVFFIKKMLASAQMYGVQAEQCPDPGAFLEDGQEIGLGNYTFRCILAPGHSPGSICFYNEHNNLLLGGDVLFYGSIGRTDLPLGNHEQLLTSIRERLMVLPGETKVFCGHGPSTTIAHEKSNNPFLTGVEGGY